VSDSEGAQRRVAGMLDSGLLGDPELRSSATVREPIPVVDPSDGALHSWFVPIAVGEQLAGFAELLPDLTFVRYSSYQRRPELAAWTDAGTIRRCAGTISRADESLGEPVLTYDRDPSRLAWAVPATDPAGHSRALYVAGDYAYEQPAHDADDPGVGGT
jgi:hypothetical protein